MPTGRRNLILIISLLFIVIIVGLDQFFKKIVEKNLAPLESLPVIKNVLHITYVKNTGILWGLFKGCNFILIIVSILTILAISFFTVKREHQFYKIFSLILIFSGAVSNLIDRFFRGYIVDFIDIRIWPVFNLADIAITVGIIFLGIGLLTSRLAWRSNEDTT